MLSCKLLLSLLLALYCTQCILAACVCSEKGRDYCQSCQGSSVVRPKPRYFEPSEVNLPPIGDNCWCSKQLIEPAQLPKTCGKKQPGKPGCSCRSHSKGSSSYSYGNSYDNSYGSSGISSSYHGYGYANEKPQDDSAPADPISVSLANEADKALKVPEAKLAFGFAQKPVEDKREEYVSNVPEENLFKLKSEVITLKKPSKVNKARDEEEYIEDEELESTADDDESLPQLTYKQLGYITEQYKNPRFRKVNSRSYYGSRYNSGYSHGYGYGYDRVPGRVSVDCGFKPGRITSYRNARRQELEGHY